MSEPTPIYSIDLNHGGLWSRIIGRGKTMRLTDLEGGANVGMLLYHAHERHERYNMPDTLKGQHIFYLRAPYCLHSDMGRLFASITQDTVGWHDTVCGCTNASLVAEKYGPLPFQEARNEYHRNARDSFLIELAKSGLGERDLVPNLNLFSKVVADDDGHLSFVKDHSKPGDHIDLRFEMDTLVVLNTCQHPLDPDSKYHPRKVKLEVFIADTVSPEDASLEVRPENARAWRNSQDYYTLSA